MSLYLTRPNACDGDTPILNGIRTGCTDALLLYDHTSTMHKAPAYLLNRWKDLVVYTTRGDLPIDPQGDWPLSRLA